MGSGGWESHCSYFQWDGNVFRGKNQRKKESHCLEAAEYPICNINLCSGSPATRRGRKLTSDPGQLTLKPFGFYLRSPWRLFPKRKIGELIVKFTRDQNPVCNAPITSRARFHARDLWRYFTYTMMVNGELTFLSKQFKRVHRLAPQAKGLFVLCTAIASKSCNLGPSIPCEVHSWSRPKTPGSREASNE
jgi:hypothetical protein